MRTIIRRGALLGAACLAPSIGAAQWTPQSSGTSADLRGLSVVSPRIAWASGTGGTVLRTTDGGATWRADTVPGASKLDFRDVKAFGASTAYVLSIGNGDQSRIYKTTDGGAHWTLQFTNDVPAGFFDAIAFFDETHGLAVSDPVDGRFMLVRTDDGGAHWTRIPPTSIPPALKGEGAYASSGTCLLAIGPDHAWLGTGGASVSRVYRSSDRGKTWSVVDVPVAAGNSTRGVFSLAFADPRVGYAIGGDYKNFAIDSATAAITRDGGKTWSPVPGRLHGYRSGAATARGGNGRVVIAVGTNGTDVSRDGGATFTRADSVEYNAVQLDASGGAWAVGPKGRIARWSGAPLSR